MNDMMDFPPQAGVAIELERGLRRVLAPNPSPLTGAGTNTYLLGDAALAVIDPGPASQPHLEALVEIIGDTPVEAILVTHSHLDHSPLARPLAKATGAPIYAFGDSFTGRSPVMERLAATGALGGGEGVDIDFAPDHTLADGARVAGTGWEVEALWTPGHFGNHLSFAWNGALFTGDHVMGWATSLVSPPDGDLTAFMRSCARLAAREDRRYFPGHGAPVDTPSERIAWLINHRLERESQILAALGQTPAEIPDLTRQVYADVPEHLWPAAERNVLAHLIDLIEKQQVSCDGELSSTAKFARK